MNESDLEKELRSLLPISPSERLAERIAADLEQVAQSREHEKAAGTIERPVKESSWFGWRSLLLPAIGLAAIAVLLVINHEGKERSRTASTHSESSTGTAVAMDETPDESVAELIEAKDEGVVYENDQPQRQVRMVFLERHTWTNPQTGAVIEFEVPREDIVLMPVAMQ